MYILVHTLVAIIYTHFISAAVARSQIATVHSCFQLWEILPTISSPKLCYLTFSPALYEDSRCWMSAFFIQSFQKQGRRTSVWSSALPWRIVMWPFFLNSWISCFVMYLFIYAACFATRVLIIYRIPFIYWVAGIIDLFWITAKSVCCKYLLQLCNLLFYFLNSVL